MENTLGISAKRLDALLEKAKSGDVKAMYVYASKCFDNDISKGDAWNWLEKAVENGHIEAMDEVAATLRKNGQIKVAATWEQRAIMEKFVRDRPVSIAGCVVGAIIGLITGGFGGLFFGVFFGLGLGPFFTSIKKEIFELGWLKFSGGFGKAVEMFFWHFCVLMWLTLILKFFICPFIFIYRGHAYFKCCKK